MTGFCPTCHQSLPEKRGRHCSECLQPIRRRHKFCFVGSSVRHMDCTNPEGSKSEKSTQQELIEVKP
jgi:hypothetical protein